ncbi:MAG: transcriptional regulator, partial [Lentisphaeraceae bacterium]|nr:transcriptional regulator [Lentisphaeraceae bacterium]
MAELKEVQDNFIHHWGTLGNAWGVNRTMTQIHALLMTEKDAMTTDQIMERLKISRGNAHSNVKELVNWKIVRQVIIPGERKDYYTAEKDTWKLLCTVARERKRREIEPALDAISQCLNESADLIGADAVEFRTQMEELSKFLEMGENILNRLGRSEK